jgi:hypothetical protein
MTVVINGSTGISTPGITNTGTETVTTQVISPIIGSASGSSLSLQSNGTTNATLDTNGNFGLGVTPSAWATSYKAMQVGTYGAVDSNSTSHYMDVTENCYYNGNWTYLASNPATLFRQAAGVYQWYNAPSGTAGGTISFTQAMTLDASGNLLVNATSTFATSSRFFLKFDEQAQIGLTLQSTNATTGGSYQYFVNSSGSLAGSISHASSTAVLYNVTSDRRLKTNIVPLTTSGAYIDALLPRKFNWTADGSADEGFITDEYQQVNPGAIVGQPNAVDAEGKPVYQQGDFSDPTMMANIVAELQSLRARLKAANIA